MAPLPCVIVRIVRRLGPPPQASVDQTFTLTVDGRNRQVILVHICPPTTRSLSALIQFVVATTATSSSSSAAGADAASLRGICIVITAAAVARCS